MFLLCGLALIVDTLTTPFSQLERKELDPGKHTWTEMRVGGTGTISTKIKIPTMLNISSNVATMLTKRDHNTCRWTDLPLPNVCHVIPRKRRKEYPILCEKRFSGRKVVVEDIDDVNNMVLLNDSVQSLWDSNEVCFVPVI